jgi:hypothetical protein
MSSGPSIPTRLRVVAADVPQDERDRLVVALAGSRVVTLLPWVIDSG